MPADRQSMRKVKEVLRLRFELGLGQRAIAQVAGWGSDTICRVPDSRFADELPTTVTFNMRPIVHSTQ